jgi:hypothetical protein
MSPARIARRGKLHPDWRGISALASARLIAEPSSFLSRVPRSVSLPLSMLDEFSNPCRSSSRFRSGRWK